MALKDFPLSLDTSGCFFSPLPGYLVSTGGAPGSRPSNDTPLFEFQSLTHLLLKAPPALPMTSSAQMCERGLSPGLVGRLVAGVFFILV